MKKTVVRITGFLLILLMVLAGINRVFKMKYGDGIYSLTKFYEQKKDSVDVLVLGSSHAFENINTGTLWDEYGMASYVLGGSRQPSWNTYYYLKEALKTQRPELIVLEGYMLLYDADYEESSRIIKNNFGLKWSKDKIESIKVSAPKSQWAEYFLEYTQYHTRYRELSREDFLKNQGYRYYDNWKGFGCNLDTVAEVGTDVKQVDEVSPLYGKTEEYYRKILDLAREENIPVLVTIAPYFLIDEKSEKMFNRVGEIAGEYGDLFLDGNKLVDEIGVDYQVDNADDVGHLNYLGNQKYTKYLGTYIKEHYTVSDRRADAAYESWQKNADYIREMIVNQELKESGDMEAICEKLQNPNYWVFISVDDSCNGEDQELQRFLGAAGLALSLALQQSLGNFAGGLLILIMKPFRVGDYIISPSGEGKVSMVGLVYTTILTTDNKAITIPNGTLSNSTVTNVTAMDKRMLELKVGIAYEADIRTAKAVLERVYREHPMVKKDEDIKVFVDSLGDSSVVLGIRGWVETSDYWQTRWDLLERIKLSFDEAGIEIPYNKMDVHLKQ